MTASAIFRLGTSTLLAGPYTYGAYDAAITALPSDFVKVDPQSTADVNTIAVTIQSADEVTLAGVLPVVTVSQVTKTATFQVPATVGHTYLVRYTVNSGTSSAAYKELAVHVLAKNAMPLAALGELDQSHRTYYWLAKLNDAIRRSLPGTYHETHGATVTTTDGAATQALTFAMPANAVAKAMIQAVGFDNLGNAAQYLGVTSWKRAGGAAAVFGAMGLPSSTEDVAGWNLTSDVSGNYGRVLVTGAAGTTVKWWVTADIDFITY